MVDTVKDLAKSAVGVAAVMTGGAFLLGTGGFFGAAGAALYFAESFVTTLVLGGISQALAKSPSSGGASILLQDRTVTSRQPVAPHVVVYGRNRIGGTILYLETTSSNKYLHSVIALTGHEIDAIESIYFNEIEVPLDGSGNVTSGQYAGKARVQYKLGTADQTAFDDLVAESDGKWTANHRVRGRALLYVRFEYDANVYFNGLPNVSAVIRGKKVYDPRTETTVWSANPALCLSDYLTSTKYGMGVDYATEIDETALAAAANICDEAVSLVAGGTENRYETHGAFATSSKPEDVINQIVSSMAGKCIWSGGVWRILAGAYYAPTLSFDEDDLRGGFRVQSLVSRRESFNGVKGVFLSPDENYTITDFPAVTSATFVAQDNDEENLKSIELPMTTSVSMAQRLAKIELLRARQQITTSLPMKLVGLNAQVGDVVQINNTRMGWVNKPFEVIGSQISFGETLGVDLELRETASNVYDWSTDEESPYDPAPNTNLPSAFTVGEVTDIRFNMNTSYTEQYGSIEWECDDAFVNSYKVIVDGESAKFDASSSNDDYGVSFTAYAKGTSNVNNEGVLTTIVRITNPDALTKEKYVIGSHVRIYGSYTKTKDWNGALTSVGGIITKVQDALSVSTFVLTVSSPIEYQSQTIWYFGYGPEYMFDTSASSGIIVNQPITQNTPSRNVYYEQIVRDKQFSGVNFASGTYIVKITPYNSLGVAGSESTAWVAVPYPPLPERVSGLELDLGEDGEANSTQWTGKDVKIKWRQASFSFPTEIDDTSPNGADYGGNDVYLKDYKVAVYNASGTLLREEFVTSTNYVYSLEKNSEDAAKQGDTAYRELSFKVWARGRQNQISEQASTL
jgi:hypothetical protein